MKFEEDMNLILLQDRSHCTTNESSNQHEELELGDGRKWFPFDRKEHDTIDDSNRLIPPGLLGL